MKMAELPKLEQGDLIRVKLTGSDIHNYRFPPPTGIGWMMVMEVSTDGRVISSNFCPDGGKGYGSVIWPAFEPKAFLRGKHGECSPFAALVTILGKVEAVALTA